MTIAFILCFVLLHVLPRVLKRPVSASSLQALETHRKQNPTRRPAATTLEHVTLHSEHVVSDRDLRLILRRNFGAIANEETEIDAFIDACSHAMMYWCNQSSHSVTTLSCSQLLHHILWANTFFLFSIKSYHTLSGGTNLYIVSPSNIYAYRIVVFSLKQNPL